MRILIADDNVDLAESLAAVLRSRGAMVRLVADGRAALSEMTRWSPDVLLVDLKMPEVSGLDVISELKRDPVPNRRIVAMTGYDSAARIAAAERLGAETVLRKPFAMMQLLRTLDLDEEGVGPEDLGHCRVLVLPEPGTPPLSLPDGCEAVTAQCRDSLLEKVGATEFDAVMLLRPEAVEELTTDLAHLDPDLAVVPSTERALLQTAVRQTRARRDATLELSVLRGVIQQAPGALVAVTGTPPRIARWSQAVRSLLGYRDDELRGALLDRLEQGLVAGELHRLVEAAREGTDHHDCVCPVRVRGGSVRPLQVQARPIAASDDAVLLVFAAPELNQRHEDDLKVLGATAAGVAHEMRNALAGVGSSLSVLENRFGQSEAAVIVGEVRERVERAAEVMNDLLDFARPLTLRLMAAPAPLVLETAAEQIRASAPDGVTVRCSVRDPSLRLLVDPVRLQMALLNLGNNAAQALSEVGGEILLSCAVVNGEVCIRVDDDGPGVPEAVRARIFEPFFTTRPQGSGLGLANVRKLVEAHGGRIALLPEVPGAHFEITLPRRPQLRETS